MKNLHILRCHLFSWNSYTMVLKLSILLPSFKCKEASNPLKRHKFPYLEAVTTKKAAIVIAA